MCAGGLGDVSKLLSLFAYVCATLRVRCVNVRVCESAWVTQRVHTRGSGSGSASVSAPVLVQT